MMLDPIAFPFANSSNAHQPSRFPGAGFCEPRRPSAEAWC
jgi:hypothetical protein